MFFLLDLFADATQEKAHGASTAYVSFDLQRHVLQAAIGQLKYVLSCIMACID